MSKKCTPLRREAHFEVKMYKTPRSGPLLEVEMSKKCTPLWREAHFEFIMRKTHHVATFGSCDSCDVEKVHAVEREARFEVKMHKTPQLRTAFGSCDVEKVHAVVTRSTFRSQKCKKLMGSEHFWTFRRRFEWQSQGIVHLGC